MKSLTRIGVLIALSGATVLCIQARVQEKRLEIQAPPTTDAVTVELSPDGEQLLIVGETEGKRQLWIHNLAAGASRPLAGTGDVSNPFPCWSPDSKSFAYFTIGALKRLDLETGSVRTVLNIGSPGRGCSWGRDGAILFSVATAREILRVPDGGGAVQRVTPPDPQYLSWPRFLPDGRHFLYFSTNSVYVTEIGGTQPVRLLEADGAAIYSRSGHLMFPRKGNLYAQKFDPVELKLSGEPFVVASEVPGAANYPAASVSANGHLAYRSAPDTGNLRQFKWFDRTGKELGNVGKPVALSAGAPMLSPDGRFIVLNQTVDGNQDIWLMELATGESTRLTTDPAGDGFPVWSGDGKTVYFASNRTGQYELYSRPITDNGAEQLVLRTPLLRLPRDVSKDGRFLLFRSGGAIVALQLDGNPMAEIPLQPGSDLPQFSPDGRWIAVQATEAGRLEVYIQKFPSGRRVRVSTNGGGHPRWNPNGKEVFYIAPDGKLNAASLELDPDKEEVRVGTPAFLFTPSLIGNVTTSGFTQQYLVSQDGQRFLIATVRKIDTPVTVIRHWQPQP